ncbi:conserved domain protein [Paenibacillus sp. HGF5]|nr:conserved domain protein [Paenibacillus sp. HGF5]
MHILCPPEHALIHSTVPIRNSSFFDFNTNWHNLGINMDEAITEKSFAAIGCGFIGETKKSADSADL